MKISLFAIPGVTAGKQNIKDSRLDEVDAITNSKKKVYVQVELTAEDACLDADAILVHESSRTDLVLKDLEFVETRLSRAQSEEEKVLLNKLKAVLEKEDFISSASFNDEEKKIMAVYGLLTNKPVIVAKETELTEPGALLFRAFMESGFISFFTTGEKETRAWLIKKGTCAWEAAGVIHSDIQKGFIRAEIISFNDFVSCGGETQAKQQGKMRLENKDYIMQDTDLVNFRFNK